MTSQSRREVQTRRKRRVQRVDTLRTARGLRGRVVQDVMPDLLAIQVDMDMVLRRRVRVVGPVRPLVEAATQPRGQVEILVPQEVRSTVVRGLASRAARSPASLVAP